MKFFIIYIKKNEYQSVVLDFLKENKIDVVRLYEHLPRLICVRMAWKDYKIIKNHKYIEYIEESKSYGGTSNTQIITTSDNWGLDRIDQRTGTNGKYCYTRLGSNVDIYILDTGIQLNHDDFNRRAYRLADYRSCVRFGSTTVYFDYKDDLNNIINKINKQLPNTASNKDNKLHLEFAIPTLISKTSTSFPELFDVFGIIPGIYQSITGITVNPVIDETHLTNFAWDDNGHGTHVAGIAGGLKYGVAKNARLYSVKCFEYTSKSETEFILEGINSTLAHHKNKKNGRPSVANMSFGGPRSNSINFAVEEMILAGITCCVAAGNNNVNAINQSPASAGVNLDTLEPIPTKKPLVVAASSIADSFAEFSNYDDSNTTLSGNGSNNYGSVVDIIAPGVGIISSFLNSINTNSIATKSGTSMAAPMVAGVAALYLDGDALTPAQVRDNIIKNSTKDVIRINNSIAIQDRTPNRLLFQPFSETSFMWDTSIGLEDGTLLVINENEPINIKINAISLDNSGNKLPVLYSVSPSLPISGTKQNIPTLGTVELECDTGKIAGQAPTVTKDTVISFTLKAVDSLGKSIDGVFKIKIINVNQSPYWITPENTTWKYTEGDNVSIYIKAEDPDDNDTLTYSILNGYLPPGLTISETTGQIYGIVSLANKGDRNYEFTVRATDKGNESIDRTFNIFITETNRKPLWNLEWLPPLVSYGDFNARSFGTFNIGDYVDIKTMAYDDDYDTLTFTIGAIKNTPPVNAISMSDLPKGLSIDRYSGQITGVINPKNNIGLYFFRIDVDDGHIHYDALGNVITPPLTEIFCIEVVDADSTIQEIPIIVYDPFENPQTIIRIPGGSRILTMSAQVLAPFTGILPRMSIGDKNDYTRLMTEKDSKLHRIGTYVTYPNYKYNSTEDVDLYITFKDDSITPQYTCTLVNTMVNNIIITNSGSGYRYAPNPYIYGGGGSGAKALSYIHAVDVKLVEEGQNYIVGDIIRIIGGSPRQNPTVFDNKYYNIDQSITLLVTSVDKNGGIVNVKVMDTGAYQIAPNNPASSDGGTPFINPQGNLIYIGANGKGAKFDIDFGIKEIKIVDKGIGYLSPPTIEFKGNGISSGSLKMTIEYIPSDVTVFFGNIKWITPSGYIGDVYETYPCSYSVKAIASGGFPVSYSLAPGSLPMPSGLYIDVVTGDIKGVCGFISKDTSFTFTIRASVGATFVDRDFSLTIRNRFTTRPVTGMYLALTGWDKRKWIEFCKKYIPESLIFRTSDKNYGINTSPMMYVIFGLNDVTDARVWEVMTGDQARLHEYDFYQKTNLYLGEIKSAVVRDGQGIVLYEVLYREIIDPLTRIYERRGNDVVKIWAGGFNAGDSLIRDPVPYAQKDSIYNKKDLRTLYPSSIVNMRKDLMAKDSGGIGLSGKEGMPLWMTSQQILGDDTSILGYVPAIEIAYIKAGQSNAVIRNLNIALDGYDEMMGQKLIFDRLLFLRYSNKETLFDENIIVPDIEQYPIVASRDLNIDNAITIYQDNTLNNTTVNPYNGLYVINDHDKNPVTPDHFNLTETKKLIQTRAEHHSKEPIMPGNPPKNPPYLTDTWNSDDVDEFHKLSDFMPHENPYGERTVFDKNSTFFDYEIVKTNRFFRFMPDDK